MAGRPRIRNLPTWLAVLFAVTTAILAVQVTTYRADYNDAKDTGDQITTLLSGDGAVRGYSCGVLNVELAAEILGVSVGQDFFQGPLPSDAGELYWHDICRYEDPSVSNRYVELFVDTYQSKELAQAAFDDVLPVVNDAKSYDPRDYGDALVYDAGVFYLLRSQAVVQVAANDASGNIEQHALSVLDRVLQRMQ